MISKKQIMFPDNDQQVTARHLFDKGTGNYFGPGATVTATLFDQAHQPVPGCIDLPLFYVAGSFGDFQGEVEETFAPPLGAGYRLVVKAVQGAADGEWTIVIEVRKRDK